MKKYKIAVTLPLTLWMEVDAASEVDAIEKARNIALKTPTEEWGDDFFTASFDVVND